MHSQEQNVKGKIFGGYIMKGAVDIAFLTVRQYSGNTNPSLETIDTISFIKPVNFGSILKYESTVVYADKKQGFVRVRVKALTISSL